MKWYEKKPPKWAYWIPAVPMAILAAALAVVELLGK